MDKSIIECLFTEGKVALSVQEQTIVTGIMAKIQRDSLAALERALCEKVGAAYCVVTGGGREALVLALRAAGARLDSSVVCPALGDPTLLHAVLYTGAKPLFADINPNTWLLDGFCVEYVLGKCVRTKQELPVAVVASSLFGLPCNFPALEAACERYGVALIEDMRGTIGGKVGFKASGTFGDYSVLTLPGGHIAAVFCKTEEHSMRLRECLDAYACPDLVSGDLAYEWLLHAEKEEAGRAKAVREYKERLRGLIRMQQVGEGYISASDAFVVAFSDIGEAERVRERLALKRLGTDKAMPVALHQMARPLGYGRVILSHTESIAGKLVPLPLHAYLNSKTIAQIAALVTSADVEDGEAHGQGA